MMHLDISHSAPGHHAVKVPGALYMEFYSTTHYEEIERTDLFSYFWVPEIASKTA